MIQFHDLADMLETLARSRGKLTREQYADLLQQTGERLLTAAEEVRQSSQPIRATGGMVDQVKMQVFGPSGNLKQTIERN